MQVKNFATGNKRKIPLPREKMAAESVRDVFGRILSMPTEKLAEFSLPGLLCYPITDMPLSLAHTDGTFLKTDKSALLRCLESKQSVTPTMDVSPTIECSVIDGGLLLHTMLPSVTGSYGSMALQILSHVCSYLGNEIHVLFDDYRDNSLKQNERNLRNAIF